MITRNNCTVKKVLPQLKESIKRNPELRAYAPAEHVFRNAMVYFRPIIDDANELYAVEKVVVKSDGTVHVGRFSPEGDYYQTESYNTKGGSLLIDKTGRYVIVDNGTEKVMRQYDMRSEVGEDGVVREVPHTCTSLNYVNYNLTGDSYTNSKIPAFEGNLFGFYRGNFEKAFERIYKELGIKNGFVEKYFLK